MKKVISIIRQIRPYYKFVFTVSPVPLAATFENGHVLSSTDDGQLCGRLQGGTSKFERLQESPLWHIYAVSARPPPADFGPHGNSNGVGGVTMPSIVTGELHYVLLSQEAVSMTPEFAGLID